MDYKIHPHTGELLIKRSFIQDADGIIEYMDDELIDELKDTGQITIVDKFEVG